MRVAVQEIRWIEVKRSALERIAKAKAEHLCVGCMKPLDKTRTIRGMHERCYRATTRSIERGIWTEADRIAEGKMLEKDTPGPEPSNPVSIEAAELRN